MLHEVLVALYHCVWGLARFGSAPTAQQTAEFCKVCAHFFRQHPNQIVGQLCGHMCHITDTLYMWVGVHCTHGYNRTGFLIIAYLVEEDDWRYSPVEPCRVLYTMYLVHFAV